MELFRFAIALILATLAGVGAAFLALFLFGARIPGGLFGYVYGVSDMEGALSMVAAALTMVATMWTMAGWLDRYEARKWAEWRNEA